MLLCCYIVMIAYWLVCLCCYLLINGICYSIVLTSEEVSFTRSLTFQGAKILIQKNKCSHFSWQQFRQYHPSQKSSYCPAGRRQNAIATACPFTGPWWTSDDQALRAGVFIHWHVHHTSKDNQLIHSVTRFRSGTTRALLCIIVSFPADETICVTLQQWPLLYLSH